MAWIAHIGEALLKRKDVYEKVIKGIVYGLISLLIISSLSLEARFGQDNGRATALKRSTATVSESTQPETTVAKTPEASGGWKQAPRPNTWASSHGNPKSPGSGVYLSERDIDLLAHLIYAEARGESFEGQVAVGAVVLNRVKNWRFPKTVAGVIYQPDAFCTVRDGQINFMPDAEAYRAARAVAAGWDPTGGALYFYNPARTTSMWIYSRPVVTVIGQHYFAA